MISNIILKQDGTINIIADKKINKEIPLREDKSVVIFEFLPIEISFDKDTSMSSVFKMVNKYKALRQLSKSISILSDLYLSKKENPSKNIFDFILFQKVVSNTINKFNEGKVERFFLTEPLMFGIKGSKVNRLEPYDLLNFIETPIHIHKHLTTKDLPLYDGFNLLELITAVFKLSNFMNEKLNPF